MRRFIHIIIYVLSPLIAAAHTLPQVLGQHPANSAGYTVHAYDDLTTDILDMKCLAEDASGFLWLATSTGLYRFDGYRFVPFRSHDGDGTGGYAVGRLATDSHGRLWCDIHRKAYIYDPQRESYTRADMRLWPKQRPHDGTFQDTEPPSAPLHRDRFGRLWRRGDIDAPGLPQAHVILEDRQDNVWYLFDCQLFRISFHASVCRPLPLITQPMRWAMLDSHKRLWLSDRYTGRLTIFNPSGGVLGYVASDGHVSQSPVPFAARPYVIYEDSRHDIWIGTKPDGLFRLRPQGDSFTLSHWTRKPGALNDNEIIDIREDRQGRLWTLGFHHGLCCIENPGSATPRFTAVKDLVTPSDVKYRSLTVTRNSVLLAATSDGLFVCDLKSSPAALAEGRGIRRHVHEERRAESLASSSLKSVVETDDGHLYVCTRDRGIDLLTSRSLLTPTLSFRHHNTAVGFPADYIKAMAEAPDGTLWLTAQNSIIEWQPQRPLPGGAATRLTLTGDDFSESTPAPMADGSWVFGTLSGAVSIHLSDLRRATTPRCKSYPIRLTSVADTDTLTLGETVRHLNISFATLCFAPTRPIVYAARLTDGDPESQDEWQYLGTTHDIAFQQLRPGTYTLELRSTDGDGAWQAETRRVTVIVTPAWHETWWARLLFLIVAILTVSGAWCAWHYIIGTNRKRRDTLSAYMQLLDTPQDKTAKPETPCQKPSEEVPQATPTQPDTDDRMIRRCVAFINRHITETDIDIDLMAQEAAVSRSQLNHKLKQMMGVTPSEMIREARIKRACQMLIDDERSINDIAYACGFTDPKYFSRCFKAAMGMSPTNYRNERGHD